MGSMVLAVVCIIALLAAGWNHYTLFYSEYQLSTWQYSLASYTPWVVLGFAFLAMIGSVVFMVSGSETREKMLDAVSTPMDAIQQGVSDSMAAMPAPSTATNSVTAGINQAITKATNILNVTNPQNAPNAKKNKSPNIPGLGFAASNV